MRHNRHVRFSLRHNVEVGQIKLAGFDICPSVVMKLCCGFTIDGPEGETGIFANPGWKLQCCSFGSYKLRAIYYVKF